MACGLVLTKLLVICVDAGDPGRIARWATDGTLPTFRSLLGRGMSGPTTNPVGLYVGAVWPSFWTSLPPTRHRRYCYSQIQLGSYKEKWPTRTPASRSTTCRVC